MPMVGVVLVPNILIFCKWCEFCSLLFCRQLLDIGIAAIDLWVQFENFGFLELNKCVIFGLFFSIK